MREYQVGGGTARAVVVEKGGCVVEKEAQDAVLGHFQPSLRDWSRLVIVPRTGVLGYSQPSLRDWSLYVLRVDLFSGEDRRGLTPISAMVGRFIRGADTFNRMCGIQQNAIVGLRPVFFGPGTLLRTWGTRPFLLTLL
jgi:hypothetical protein